MKSIKTPFVLTLIAALALTVGAIGCKEKTTSEKAADAMGDAKDALKDAANKTGEAIKDGAKATKDAVTNAVNSVTSTNK